MSNRALEPYIAQCEDKVDYVFKNKEICKEAICTKLAFGIDKAIGGRSHFDNARLAVLGEAAMTYVLCPKWHANSELDKGIWDCIRQKRLSYKFLSVVGLQHRLDACLDAGTAGKISASMMARSVQAILGAVALDGGPNELERVMTRLGLMDMTTD